MPDGSAGTYSPASAIVIAVDGPSGSGKSSVSRGVAAQLGLCYLDTGAMYRAAAWWMLQQGIDLDDPDAIAGRADELAIASGTDPSRPTIAVNGVDVGEPIRDSAVTGAVSTVSAVPAIRARLVQLQRQHVTDACRQGGGIVVEGRDIGTVVLPDADLKVFLTANQEVRAQRRAQQDELEGRAADVTATASSLAARDAADSSRTASPLTQAADAHLVDATDLTLAQVIEAVVALANEARTDTKGRPAHAGG
ncbi:MAG: (d)CMP kinase [Actinomycetes bacterium]